MGREDRNVFMQQHQKKKKKKKKIQVEGQKSKALFSKGPRKTGKGKLVFPQPSD